MLRDCRLAALAAWAAAACGGGALLASQAAAAPGDPARAGGTTIEVAADLPVFSGKVATLSNARRKAITGPVWRKGCPIGLGSLRAVSVQHISFDGTAKDGVIIVHKAHARTILRVFERLYEQRFPIRRMHPIERYGGSDSKSIDADNTSAFNCRRVTGGTGWSEHAYGRALDLNPIENPYIHADGTTSHKASRPYLDRDDVRPGMAVAGSAAVTAFDARGWSWGGTWASPVDTQHFSTTGR